MSDLLDKILNHPTYRGLYGGECQMNQSDLVLMNIAIARHKSLKNFIELGTGSGFTSAMLSRCAAVRNGAFVTFDNEDRRIMFVSGFRREDLTGAKTTEAVIDLVSMDNTFVLFDNGNKSLEFDTFGRHMNPGSIAAVHDVGTEVPEERLEELCSKFGFLEDLRPERQALGSMLRILMKYA